MEWDVFISKPAFKTAKKMPPREQELLRVLLEDLALTGPLQPGWPNYSKLGKNKYHCHLSYKWVACWQIEDDELKLIEIYYAGSRENAPYK